MKVSGKCVWLFSHTRVNNFFKLRVCSLFFSCYKFFSKQKIGLCDEFFKLALIIDLFVFIHRKSFRNRRSLSTINTSFIGVFRRIRIPNTFHGLSFNHSTSCSFIFTWKSSCFYTVFMTYLHMLKSVFFTSDKKYVLSSEIERVAYPTQAIFSSIQGKIWLGYDWKSSLSKKNNFSRNFFSA